MYRAMTILAGAALILARAPTATAQDAPDATGAESLLVAVDLPTEAAVTRMAAASPVAPQKPSR